MRSQRVEDCLQHSIGFLIFFTNWLQAQITHMPKCALTSQRATLENKCLITRKKWSIDWPNWLYSTTMEAVKRVILFIAFIILHWKATQSYYSRCSCSILHKSCRLHHAHSILICLDANQMQEFKWLPDIDQSNVICHQSWRWCKGKYTYTVGHKQLATNLGNMYSRIENFCWCIWLLYL